MNILGAYGDFKQERKIGEYTIYLPDPPNIKDIHGRDLSTSQQKFQRTNIHANKLLSWPIKDQEAFVKSQWKNRIKGYWWWNGGKLEYAAGTHWFYMNNWYLENQYPNFTDRDRDFFYLWKFGVENDKQCTGLVLIGKRRDGKTHRGNCIVYDRTSKAMQAMGGIQSKTDKDGARVFNKLIRSWKRLPFYFRPQDEGDDHPKGALRFYAPKKRDTKADQRMREYIDALESEINFESVTDEAYDGQKLIVVFSDEFCKCLGYDTPVLMFDGSVRMVQDISEGELLMGDDSTSRTVQSISRGQEQMYDIVPNKGMVWSCNESHILSLKVNTTSSFPRKKYTCVKGDVLNITVRDYLTLNESQKKSLCLYKVPIEYGENTHDIPPYILGAWLGDGTSKSSEFTSADHEIVIEFNTYANSIGATLKLKKNCKDIIYSVSKPDKRCPNTGRLIGNGGLRTKLGEINVLNNKHIPNDYLIDSRENRLQLLAGLIDTDGYAIKSTAGVSGYQVCQKRRVLAEGIKTLAGSLGFYASLTERTATMKRDDGSVYKCQVFSVGIFGDVENIPCRVERKKAYKRSEHKNRRNPLHTGFKVIKKDIGDYYGFAISGNRLFVLGDYTVTHNTIKGDVHARSQVLNECMVVGTTVVGKQIWTSTVEEMVKKGGAQGKKVWDDSAPESMTQNGRTVSGMKRLFVPASIGMEGDDPLDGKPFVNEFGYSDQPKAEAYVQREYNSRKGETKRSFRRKYPLKSTDAFLVESDGGHFDEEKIDEQLEYLPTWTGKLREGEFAWEEGFGTRVVWRERDVEKPFFRALMFMDNDQLGPSNNIGYNMDGELMPRNTKEIVAGTDPFDHKKTAENKNSSAAAYFFIKHNPLNPKNTGLIAMEYYGRRSTPNKYYEDMLMACIYFGCQINPENTKSGIINYFDEKGYGHFIMKRPDSTIDPNAKGRGGDTDGTPSNTEFVINRHLESMIQYVDAYCHLIYYKELLEELLRFNVTDRTLYDRVMAFGYTLLAALAKKHFNYEEQAVDVSNYYEEIDNSPQVDDFTSTAYGVDY